ncbi:cyclin-T2-like [Ischnura elegans]|uniref:cyclin-T2-like n=1 Tax=Ischnura elegans TaxID=197161 RepID=UPI001ED8B8A4|nr:cyclin-T2-like [Ischnura elegans]
MAAEEKWYFTKEQLANSPSKKCGIDADKELSFRQHAANFIQDMGQRLQVSQLCINTAIVYMHRFYIFHSFTHFHRNAIAAAALFLAAKVEEQPRKLEHVIKVAHICLHRELPPLDTKSELYLEQAQMLVFNENVLLQTLGFDVAIDHPHTHVVRCCHLVRASKDLAQTSYFMASNSLHLTTMCLQYKPTVVACFCIHLACKWSNWGIPQSSEGKEWFWYVDKTVTQELLEELTAEFLVIFDQCPSRLKMKIMSVSAAAQNPHIAHGLGYQLEMEPRKRNAPSSKSQSSVPPGGSSSSQRPHHPSDPSKANAGVVPTEEQKKHRHDHAQQRVDYRDYKEKKERERAAAAAAAAAAGRPRAEQHQVPNTSQAKQAGMSSGQPPISSREAIKLAASNKRERMARDAILREELASAVMEAENSMASSEATNHIQAPIPHHINSQETLHREAKLVTSRPQLPSGSSSRPPLPQRPDYRERQREERGGDRPPLFPEGPKSQGHPPQAPGEPKAGDQRPFNHHHHHHHHGRAEPPPGGRDGRHRQPPPGMPNVPSERKLDVSGRPREGKEGMMPSMMVKREGLSRPLREGDEGGRPPDGGKLAPSSSHHPRSQPTTPKARSRSPLPPSPAVSSVPTPPVSAHHRPSKPKSPSSISGAVEKATARGSVPPPLPSLSLASASDDVRKGEVTPGRLSESKPVLDSNDNQAHQLARTEKSEALHSTPEKRPPEGSQRSGGRSRGTPDKRWSQSQSSALDVSAGSMAAPPAPQQAHNAPPQPSTTPPPPTTPSTPMGGIPTTPTSTPGTPGRFLRTRNRTTSSGSEPELVPVVQKLETIPLYEALFRDTSTGTAGNSSVGGIKLPGRVPELIQPIRDRRPPAPAPGTAPVVTRDAVAQPPLPAKEMRPPELIRPFASEARDSEASSATDSSSTQMPTPDIPESTTSPDAPTPTPTPTTATASQPVVVQTSPVIGEVSKSSENHRSEKKKKKDKHKHKEKEKYREEKKHKGHRHRTKDKEGSHVVEASPPPVAEVPIRITIPKDKINLSSTPSSSKSSKPSILPAKAITAMEHPSPSLKIKIPKDRLKGTTSSPQPQQSPASTPGIKIKISKDMIRDTSAVSESVLSVTPSSGGRKRDRDRSPGSASASSKVARLDGAGPTSTMTSSSAQRRSYKQNGIEKRQHQQSPLTAPPPGSKVPQKLDSSYQYKGCLQ